MATKGASAAVSDDKRWIPLIQDDTPLLRLRAVEILDALVKLPASRFFSVPVSDEFAPGYSQEIKYKVDFGKMRSKLDKKVYRTMGDFYKDIKAIVFNCRQYNGAKSSFAMDTADPVEAKLLELYSARYGQAKPIKSETDTMKRWFKMMQNKKQARWFLYPVNSEQLPEYFNVIKREDARDFGTILSRLSSTSTGKASGYTSLSSIDEDVYQCLTNARKFNPEMSEPHQDAIWLGKQWDKMRAEMEPHRKGRYQDVVWTKLK